MGTGFQICLSTKPFVKPALVCTPLHVPEAFLQSLPCFAGLHTRLRAIASSLWRLAQESGAGPAVFLCHAEHVVSHSQLIVVLSIMITAATLSVKTKAFIVGMS